MGVLEVLSVALAIAHIPSSQAHDHIHSLHRRQSIPSTLPGTWTSQGCVTDNVGGIRTLQSSSTAGPTMTIENCLAFCTSGGYIYAGVEYADECYCGDTLSSGSTSAPLTDCDMTCAGNAQEWCGAGNRLNLFWNGQTPPAPPEVVPSVNGWVSLGCYSDNVDGRALPNGEGTTGAVTIESCTAACLAAGYSMAGAEYADQCFCGNAIVNGGASISESSCNMVCAGNSSEYCGGPNALNVYNYTGTSSTGGGGGGGGSSGSGPVVVPSVGDWISLGCYSDNVGARSLPNGENTNGAVTIESCTAACFAAGYSIAGAEYSGQCFCGNAIINGGAPISESSCNMVCAGNSLEYCGGPNALNVYNYTGTGLGSTGGGGGGSGPIVVPSVGDWISLGCYSDNVDGRALPNGEPTTGAVTIESCTAACLADGYPLAGAEYADQCYCGTAIINGGAPISESSCNMVCAGNSSEYCGGPNALNVYNYTGTALSTKGGGGGGGDGGVTSTTGTTIFPVLSGLPTGWAYNACWVDNAFGRALTFALPGSDTNTAEECIASCIANNYTIAGTEYSDQCYCGDNLIEAATIASDQTTCNMACAGNATEACGGPNRLSVYASTTIVALPVPTAMTTNLPGNWSYAGCLREPTNGRMFPYEIQWISNNSATACMDQCAAFGYSAAGVEYGIQCFCGDISDVTAQNGVFGAASECSMPCSGDPIHMCGGESRLSTYYWNGTLSNWHTPSNTGYYEFFVPGIVVPLIATVGINNKVTFLEKDGTGPPNSTGAYELDLSLSNDFDTMWRTMHVQTDVFCSGSVIMPDIAGRQINVGGWSLDSTFGVRLYTPSGSAGVNGTTDWEENWEILSLQVGRWYPTASIIANGSILVIGGETGSNASPQPNLEILPKPAGGSTIIDLPWLAATDPYNLYPFVTVLPSKNLFVAYYNEARILEPVGFTTLVQLPNIPGAVNDFTAGRTYPLEGSMMPFPQFAPYTDPLRVLICGGSTIGAGVALDNCVSIEPEATNPTWTLERMPSQRVMTCMVALPDGTMMIMNGAQQGVAGFGLATNPNLNAILYDPTQPVGSRFSILSNTIVARMYHSEATLLPDGRVLISGSDPQTNFPNGTVEFPEEYRIEVYIPPYLNQGFTQPTYSISVTDWAYGQTYQITNVRLFQGNTMRVSLIAASSSTHGNAMGARTLFPAFTCAGSTCTITAPPNAGVSPPGWFQLFILDGPTPSHSTWVRIGGDPSQLGNWPDLPGFTTPGL